MSSQRVLREGHGEGRTGGALGFFLRQLSRLWPKKKPKPPGVLSVIRGGREPDDPRVAEWGRRDG